MGKDFSVKELENAILHDDTMSFQDQKDTIDFVEAKADSFRQYFNAVYRHVKGSELNRTLLSADRITIDDYQQSTMDLDKTRRMKHDLAIDACSKLNRLCDMYGVERICPDVAIDDAGKCMNRGEIADFVGQLMYNTYQQGIGKPTLAQIREQYALQYGDRTNLDAAFIVAENDMRNPEEAYAKTDNVIDTEDELDDYDDWDFDPADD